MSHQSEAILENNLIKQLIGLGYESAKIMDGAALVSVYRKTTKNR
jgi:type I restriction enzyme R subunit